MSQPTTLLPCAWMVWVSGPLSTNTHKTRKKEIARRHQRNPRIHCLKVVTFPASHDVGPQIDGRSFPPRPRFSAVEVPGKEREKPRACQVGSNVLHARPFPSRVLAPHTGKLVFPYFAHGRKQAKEPRFLPCLSVTGPRADLQSTVVALIYPFRCRRTVFGNTPKSIAPGDAPEPSSLSAVSARDLGWAVSWLTSSSGGHVGFFFSCLSAGLLYLESLTTAETFDSSGAASCEVGRVVVILCHDPTG